MNREELHAQLIEKMSPEIKALYEMHKAKLMESSMKLHEEFKKIRSTLPIEKSMEALSKYMSDKMAEGKAIWNSAPQELRDYLAEFESLYSGGPL